MHEAISDTGPILHLCEINKLLELFREHRISAGKAAELLGLSYREFFDLLQAKDIPMVTTPPRGHQEVTDLFCPAEGSA